MSGLFFGGKGGKTPLKRKNTRSNLLDAFRNGMYPYSPKEAAMPIDSPDSSIIDMFSKLTAQWLETANTKYDKRSREKPEGLYYPEDYSTKFGSGKNAQSLQGIAPPEFWNLANSNIFILRAGKSAAAALNAFGKGPTIAECATTIQWAMFKALEEILGTKIFDATFSSGETGKFFISANLFAPVDTSIGIETNSFEERLRKGNPIYELFEPSHNDAGRVPLSENDINVGDIVYIKGVPEYKLKHLSGSEPGWNVICVGINANGDKLYNGFGPDSFSIPKTYKKIRQVLIAGYNKDQTEDTKSIVKMLSESGDPIKIKKATVVSYRAKDQKDEIFGLQFRLRLNPTVLKKLVESKNEQNKRPFGYISATPKAVTGSFPITGEITQLATIQKENQASAFATFKTSGDEIKTKMFDHATEFAKLVVGRTPSTPLGLILCGNPGIGKSHLCIAAANEAKANGCRVLYVDQKYISKLYDDKIMELMESGVSSYEEQDKITRDMFTKLLTPKATSSQQSGYGLVIFDDYNVELSADGAKHFVKALMEHVFKNNTAFMINSNRDIHVKSLIDEYIPLSDPRNNCIAVLRDLNLQSLRTEWWNTLSVDALSNSPLAIISTNVPSNQGIGIIIENKDVKLEEELEAYKLLSNNKSERIKICGDPHDKINRQRISPENYYLKDIGQYDTFLIKASSNDSIEVEQLIKLVDHAYDEGKKIILFTDDYKALREKYMEKLKFDPKKDRLSSIFDKMFLTPEHYESQHRSTIQQSQVIQDTSNAIKHSSLNNF